ncbi:hypothetical protein C1646_695596, partial [Rhizophagus diaphanus]
MTKRLLIIALFGLLLALACVLGQATAQEATNDAQVAKDGETKAKEAAPKLPVEEKPVKAPVKDINLPKGVAKGKTKPSNVGKGKAKGKGKKSPPTPPNGQTETPTVAPDNSTVPVPTNPAAPANSAEPIVPNAKDPKAKAKAPKVPIGKTVQSPTPVGKQTTPTQSKYQPPNPPAPPAPPAALPSTAPIPDNSQSPPPNVPAPETPEDSDSESPQTVKIVKEQKPQTTTVVTVIKKQDQAIEQNDTSAARRNENFIQLGISLIFVVLGANFI